MKRTALSALMSGSAPAPVHQIGKVNKKPTAVAGSRPSSRAINVLKTSFNPSKTDEFTEEDYLIIDFVNESGTKAYGDFQRKIKNRLACWELTYRLRTIPAAYFATEELSQQTLATAHEDFDEYELHYIHQSYCDHSELNRIVKDILLTFLDPKTYLLNAQVKVQPLNLADFYRTHGHFKNPITPGADYEINYWFDGDNPDNADLFTRPLTSSVVPYISGEKNGNN